MRARPRPGPLGPGPIGPRDAMRAWRIRARPFMAQWAHDAKAQGAHYGPAQEGPNPKLFRITTGQDY